MLRPLLLLVCLALLAVGCESKPETPAPERAPEPPPATAPQVAVPAPPAPAPVALLGAPLEATLVEYGTQALPEWRRCRDAAPALVILSRDPQLQRVPEPLQREVNDLILSGEDEELVARTNAGRPNPLLLPLMAVDAALRAGLFAEVVWVFPSTVTLEELQLEVFRKQLLEFGAVDEAEAQSFSLDDGVFAGTVRGVPFRAVHPDALPAIDRPVVLHIDQNFFPPLYKGEIKTPLYPLLYDTLRKLRSAGWQACAATVARSTVTGELPLESRFISSDLAALLTDPEQLDQPLPLFWGQRANALYLPNFFQNEKIRDLYMEMEAAAPKDASVQYGLYKIHRELKEGGTALEYLSQTVFLDRAYAFEYLELAPVAREKGRPDQALRMLQLARDALPDNPFVAMALASALIEMRHGDAALKILAPLAGLPWSPVYFPDMAGRIEAMMAAAEESQTKVEKTSTE